MDTKSYKSKRGIRGISGNRYEDTLLYFESNESHPIAFK